MRQARCRHSAADQFGAGILFAVSGGLLVFLLYQKGRDAQDRAAAEEVRAAQFGIAEGGEPDAEMVAIAHGCERSAARSQIPNCAQAASAHSTVAIQDPPHTSVCDKDRAPFLAESRYLLAKRLRDRSWAGVVART